MRKLDTESVTEPEDFDALISKKSLFEPKKEQETGADKNYLEFVIDPEL